MLKITDNDVKLKSLVIKKIEKHIGEKLKPQVTISHNAVEILTLQEFRRGAVVEVKFVTESEVQGKAEFLIRFSQKLEELKVYLLSLTLKNKELFSALSEESLIVDLKDNPKIILLCPNCKEVEILNPGQITKNWVEVISDTVACPAVNGGEGYAFSVWSMAVDYSDTSDYFVMHEQCGEKLFGHTLEDVAIILDNEGNLGFGDYWEDNFAKSDLEDFKLLIKQKLVE